MGLQFFDRVRVGHVLGGVLALLQLVALLWFAIPTGLPLDDAWIHQVVARTFAESGTLGYAPGEHGAAATSYLWAALLAVNFKWLHTSPVRWAFALNVIAQLTTGQLLFALLARRKEGAEGELGSSILAFAATLLACTSANVLWFAHSGMESSLFVALSVTAVWAVTAPAATPRLSLIGGIAGALVALTRPEGAPVCGLLLAYALYRRQNAQERLRRFLALAVPATVAGILYVGSNLAKTGHATPTTLEGRRWLWFESTAGLNSLDRASDFVDVWVERLGSYTFDASSAAMWMSLALAAYGAVVIVRSSGDGIRVLLAWGALHTAAYVFLLPTPGHGGRYQPFVPLLYAACVGVGTASVVRQVVPTILRVGPRVATAVSLAAILPWLGLGLTSTAKLRAAHALAVAHIEATEIDTGRFIDTLPPGGAVASFDIGGIGWATRRPILDAGGLSDPRTASLLEQGRIWEQLKRRDVRWVVLPEGGERVLPVVDHFVSRLHLDNPAVRLTRIHEIETPFERWAPAIVATWNAAPKQVVYRIEYTEDAGPADVALPAAGVRRPVRDDAAMVAPRDRVVAERSLAVLETWGVQTSVHVLPAASTTPSPEATCSVFIGHWGITTTGCDAIADPAVLRGMLYEHAGRYLAVSDLGGAVREIPHVIALAKRLRDPRFHPPLAPVSPPTAAPHRSSVSWGIPVMLFGLVLLLGIEHLLARRPRSATKPVAMRTAVPAVLAMLVLACASLIAGCPTPRGELLEARGRGTVELALARGADLEARDGEGRTPLMVAAAAGDHDTVALFLERGARADARDNDGATALHHAARGGHDACLLMVARAGAPLEATAGVRKRTALHEATLAGSAGSVRALLAAGSRVGAADGFGETALHLVARLDPARASGIASQLLAAGADPSIADARGFTAMHAAAAVDHLPLLREILHDAAAAAALEKANPSFETPVETAIRYGSDRAADALLRSGATLRAGSAMPPLHDAARMNAVGRAAVLLAAGADPSFLFGGKSARDVAREYGSRGIEALLNARSP
jgi:ankyrin repeat protein